MGTVYKAVDETLEREIGDQVPQPGSADPDILTGFRAERRRSRALIIPTSPRSSS